MIKSDYSDHQMAKYLNDTDKNWHTKKVNDTTTEFYSGNILIAIGIYSNAKCTREFYIL